MKYKYYLGQVLVCESSAKVKFTERYPSIREEVEEIKKKSTVENVETTDAIDVKEEQ
jgi:hypothetical protein